MLGGNSQKVRVYCQGASDDEIKPKLYRGEKEPRDAKTRPDQLPSDLQKLVNVLDDRAIMRCKDNCSVPEKLQPHMGTITDSVEDIGDGNMKRGVVRARETIKRMEATFDTIDSNKSTASKTVIKNVTNFILFLLAVGVMELIKMRVQGK